MLSPPRHTTVSCKLCQHSSEATVWWCQKGNIICKHRCHDNVTKLDTLQTFSTSLSGLIFAKNLSTDLSEWFAAAPSHRNTLCSSWCVKGCQGTSTIVSLPSGRVPKVQVVVQSSFLITWFFGLRSSSKCFTFTFQPVLPVFRPLQVFQLSSLPAWLWELVVWPRRTPSSEVYPLWKPWAARQSSALTRLVPSPPTRCVSLRYVYIHSTRVFNLESPLMTRNESKPNAETLFPCRCSSLIESMVTMFPSVSLTSQAQSTPQREKCKYQKS